MAHIPVLLKEVINGLHIGQGATVLDATFGGGGHSEAICRAIGGQGSLFAIDVDPAAKERALQKDLSVCRFELISGNFRHLDEMLAGRNISQLDGALFDLGLSSFQLDSSGRGFTFQKDEPLQMTFGENLKTGLTAGEIVNSWGEASMADIIYGYGGEQFARRIAKKIVEERVVSPIRTTFDLVAIIERAVPDFYKRRKIHFATKTFQALRITVNDEVRALREVLDKVWPFMVSGGRLAVISFHEIEDRIVKRFFVAKNKAGQAVIVTKKPIVPGEEEIKANPRSRSAKLRIAERR